MSRAWLALAGVIALARPAQAQCVLDSVSGVAFGTYDTFSSAPLDSSGSVTCRCLVALGVSIDLSAGSSGSFANRTMTKIGGTDTLSYNLFLDVARVLIWGNGSNGTVHYTNLGLLSALTIPIYGRVPARQDVATGNYSDVVVVTLNY